MQLNDKWKKGKCGLTFVSKLLGKSAGKMSVVVLFRGITKVTSYFSRLPSFPPGACSSSSSIQVKGKYVHVLEDKQTWAHTSLLGGQGPWLSRAACGGLSGGCVKPTTAWKVRKPAELRRVSWWAPHLPARSSPTLVECLLCADSLRNALWDPPSHTGTVFVYLSISAALGLHCGAQAFSPCGWCWLLQLRYAGLAAPQHVGS